MREPDPRASGDDLAVPAERRLRFRYPDLPYPPPEHRRNYDSESLFWTGGQLYLLTKHRSDTKTRLWRLPSLVTEEEQVLEPPALIVLDIVAQVFEPTAPLPPSSRSP